MLELGTKIILIDLATDCYRYCTKKMGCLAEECKKLLSKELDRTLYTGRNTPKIYLNAERRVAIWLA